MSAPNYKIQVNSATVYSADSYNEGFYDVLNAVEHTLRLLGKDYQKEENKKSYEGNILSRKCIHPLADNTRTRRACNPRYGFKKKKANIYGRHSKSKKSGRKCNRS